LVVGGAKSYAYKTKYGCTKKRKIQVKQKGITLDRANDEVINFDTMRELVLNTNEKGAVDPKTNKEFDPTRQIQSKERFQFKWDSQTKDIITTHISRSIRSTINEKRTIDGVDTKPFGWVDKTGCTIN
jgi:hypothetical protein